MEGIKGIYVFTRESASRRTIKISAAENSESKRIDVKILKKHLRKIWIKYYFICGSIGFVRDLWKELKKNNVQEDFIRVDLFMINLFYFIILTGHINHRVFGAFVFQPQTQISSTSLEFLVADYLYPL